MNEDDMYTEEGEEIFGTDLLDLCAIIDYVKGYLFVDSVSLNIDNEDNITLRVVHNNVGAEFPITKEMMAHCTIEEMVGEMAFVLAEESYHQQSPMLH